VQGVALGEFVGEGRVLEVPHEGSGVEKVDGGDAEFGGWWWSHQENSLGLVYWMLDEGVRCSGRW